jgi:hypothetical protein
MKAVAVQHTGMAACGVSLSDRYALATTDL